MTWRQINRQIIKNGNKNMNGENSKQQNRPDKSIFFQYDFNDLIKLCYQYNQKLSSRKSKVIRRKKNGRTFNIQLNDLEGGAELLQQSLHRRAVRTVCFADQQKMLVSLKTD